MLKFIFIFLIILLLTLLIMVKTDPYKVGKFFNTISPRSKEFIETNDIWCKVLRDNYTTILDEYQEYTLNNQMKRYGDIDPMQKQVDNNIPWKVIILRLYNKDTENMKHFPKTEQLVSGVPGCSTIMFSVLSPGQVIKPHIGPYRGVLRYHLGLIVPKDETCYINVNNIKYIWKLGQDVLFDDTYFHDVVNKTDEPRVVLFMDIKKHFDNILLDVINSFILLLMQYNNGISKIVSRT